MSVRDIRLFGDPVLKSVSDPVVEITDSIRRLVLDLEETTSLPGRAGVAAPQIGVALRVFSYKVEDQLGHLINPEILEFSGGPIDLDEGCLSLPEIWAKTPRYESVLVRGQTAAGEVVEFNASGLMAQVIQHEVDHLDGILYVDRLSQDARKKAMQDLRQTSWFG
jgi:peptide deformylase